MDTSLYSKGIGINNKIIPHRLSFSKDDGVSALEEATNVLIDHAGELVSRKGATLLESGVFHSPWPCDGGFYVIEDRDTDSAIHRVIFGANGLISTMNGIWAGLIKGQKMSYFKLGNETFYSNGYQRGRLLADVRSAWPVSEWTGHNDNRNFITLPTGLHIEMLSGVVISAVGNEIFYTPPGLPGIMDAARARRRFEADITMLCSVQSGLYVSTTDAVYFLAGVDPEQWKVQKVLSYPAYGKNPELVDPSFLGFETTKLSGLFSTVNGPVVGLSDGTCVNLIDKNVKTSGCKKGMIMVVDETMILT